MLLLFIIIFTTFCLSENLKGNEPDGQGKTSHKSVFAPGVCVGMGCGVCGCILLPRKRKSEKTREKRKNNLEKLTYMTISSLQICQN